MALFHRYLQGILVSFFLNSKSYSSGLKATKPNIFFWCVQLQEKASSMEQQSRYPYSGPWHLAKSCPGSLPIANHEKGEEGQWKSSISRNQRRFEEHTVNDLVFFSH